MIGLLVSIEKSLGKVRKMVSFSEKLNMLRAGVLGANDGIVSTAGVVIGVAATTGHQYLRNCCPGQPKPHADGLHQCQTGPSPSPPSRPQKCHGWPHDHVSHLPAWKPLLNHRTSK